jgi:four helix bundle protein
MQQPNYEKLIVWQKGVDLAVDIYELTKKFPKDEIYGLTSQMRRSSISISSNIAEGSERNSKQEFKHFLAIAKGSCAELKTQLIISFRVNFISNEEFELIHLKILEILKMLGKFISNLVIIT